MQVTARESAMKSCSSGSPNTLDRNQDASSSLSVLWGASPGCSDGTKLRPNRLVQSVLPQRSDHQWDRDDDHPHTHRLREECSTREEICPPTPCMRCQSVQG